MAKVRTSGESAVDERISVRESCAVSLQAVLGAGLVAALVLAAVAVVRHGWTWTGLAHKTLWDWLQLLVVPLVLAGVAFALSAAQSGRDQRREDRRAARELAIAADARREEALRSYLQQMNELLLHERLAARTPSPARNVARTLTLTVVRQLDGVRKGLVVRFLFESGLLTSTSKLHSPLWNPVRLRGADLRGASLRGTRFDYGFAQLGDADWRGADFRDTSFPQGVDFTRADLRDTDFSEADIGAGGVVNPFDPGPIVRRTPFVNACLTGARFTGAFLAGVRFQFASGVHVSLRRANLEDADFREAALGDVDLDDAVTTRARFPRAWRHASRGEHSAGVPLKSGECDRHRFR